MEEHLPWRAELIDRINWLVQLRWLAVIGTLGAIIVADSRLPGVLPLIRLISLTAFIALYNVFFYVYAHELRCWKDQRAKLHYATLLVHAQIILDLICLTLLLHYSGGIESPFSAYFVLHIILASILLSRTASFLYAALATTLYTGFALAEYAHVINHVHLIGIVDPDLYRRETYVIAAIFALATTLFFAVYIASSITSRLRSRERELMEARETLQARSDELSEANEQLEKLDETKTRFLLTVTHELRAPVAAIQSYLDLMLQGYVAQEKQHEVLQRSRNRAAELLNLIADLLQLARIRELDRRTTETQPVDVAAALREVLDLFRGEAEAKKLAIEVAIEHSGPTVVPAREDHVKAIWTNLISNAIKYTPPGGSIAITLGSENGQVTGTVRDTGIGIPVESLPHIFEEFYRTDEAKAMVAQGTGLGLSITRRLIETYGGHIEVQSQAGKGSTFKFKLPRLSAYTPPLSQPSEVGGAKPGA
jgi:signal transduction histidine kinase